MTWKQCNMGRVYLTRRNLMTLLAKLDRVASGGQSHRAIIKSDDRHSVYPQSEPQIAVIALEDHEYYLDRPAGETKEVLHH